MEDKINQIDLAKNKPKKRVLFIITQSEFGGAQKFLSQLISNLDHDKFEVAVVTGPDGNKEITALLPEKTEYVTAKKLRRNPNVFSDISSLFELKKIIKKFKPDVLFLNSSKAGFNGSLAARLLQTTNYKLQTIYRIGGWTFNDPWPWWKRLAYRLMEKFSSSWKDYIIVNNKHDYDQAIKFGIKPKKELVLIHNGIDPYKLNFLEKNEAKIRLYELMPHKQARFLHEGLIIGTIANFYPTKGLNILIEAIKILTTNYQLPTTNFVIIGDGLERENLKSQIANLKLENKIFLAGRIPDAYKYLKAFDIFVLPSVKEGFPWALLEAMSARLPVVATTVGANPEIIEDQKNGLLVRPADTQMLAEALKQLIENGSLRQEFGIQAHQTVLHKFDLRKMVSKIEALL